MMALPRGAAPGLRNGEGVFEIELTSPRPARQGRYGARATAGNAGHRVLGNRAVAAPGDHSSIPASEITLIENEVARRVVALAGNLKEQWANHDKHLSGHSKNTVV
jgi:hypothetical protein